MSGQVAKMNLLVGVVLWCFSNSVGHCSHLCVLCREVRADGTCVYVGQSVTHPACPPKRGLVRGNVKFAGWRVRPVPGDAYQCDVVYVCVVDLKGVVPTFVINKISEMQPLCIHGIACIAQEASEGILAEYVHKPPPPERRVELRRGRGGVEGSSPRPWSIYIYIYI